MTQEDTAEIKIEDLNSLRTAPKLNEKQMKVLFIQAKNIIQKAEWLTIGVMAPSISKGLEAVKEIETKLKLNPLKSVTIPNSKGPIFLKANQKTGEIHARIEYGLGEGILISCHKHDNSMGAETIGPFPLDFFK